MKHIMKITTIFAFAIMAFSCGNSTNSTKNEIANCQDWSDLRNHLNQNQLNTYNQLDGRWRNAHNMSEATYDNFLRENASFCRRVGATTLAEHFEYQTSAAYKKEREDANYKAAIKQMEKASKTYRDSHYEGTITRD